MSLDDAIKQVVREALAEVLPGMLASMQSQPAPKNSRKTLTINELRAQYGVGRGQLLRLIQTGKLPAVAVVMRGGRQGWRIRCEDAERVLAGSKAER